MKMTSLRSLLRRQRQKGFSLVETLMTTGIISTAALSTLGLLAGSLNTSQDGNLRSKAMVVAQDLFHDLQLGALDITPAATDERQTKALRPLATPVIPRQVFLYSQAGLLPDQKKLPKGTLTQAYEKGIGRADVAWLVSIEGIASTSYAPPAAVEGQGQVLELPQMQNVAPLGSAAYDFMTVSSPIDPTAAPPAKAGALSQVRITVESPPSAPKEQRKVYSYDFYWNP